MTAGPTGQTPPFIAMWCARDRRTTATDTTAVFVRTDTVEAQAAGQLSAGKIVCVKVVVEEGPGKQKQGWRERERESEEARGGKEEWWWRICGGSVVVILCFFVNECQEVRAVRQLVDAAGTQLTQHDIRF